MYVYTKQQPTHYNISVLWYYESSTSPQDPLASYDFAWDDEDPSPDENEEGEGPNSHGTSCAGEIAMSRDCSCGVGVAYGCSIGGGLMLEFSLKKHFVHTQTPKRSGCWEGSRSFPKSKLKVCDFEYSDVYKNTHKLEH